MWRSWYSGQERQALSSMDQVTACRGEVAMPAYRASSGLLKDSSLDMAAPRTYSSVSRWACMAPWVGEETQSGGAMEVEYSGRMMFGKPSDLREKASGTTCLLPGTWTGVNLNLRVFCLKLNSLGFVMLSRLASPNIFIKGLWSMANNRLGWPKMNGLHFSRANTAANPSPSMGGYLLSAGVLNLEPQ